jgi:predicted ester cyclase
MRAAVNAADAKGYARLYAPNAVITIHGGGELRGRAAIEQYEVGLLREFPGTQFAIYSSWLKWPLAVVHYGVNSPAAGGRHTGHEGLLFFRFDSSGLIETERRYFDSMTPMAQLGLLGATPARSVPTLPIAMQSYFSTGSRAEAMNLTFVRLSLALLESKRESAFLASLAPEVVVDELIQPEPYVGARNAKTWFDYWSGAVPDASSETISILGVGEFVLAESVLRGTLQGALAPLSPSGKPIAVHRAWVFQRRGGKLIRVASFMNRKEIAEAVGQWPPSQLK